MLELSWSPITNSDDEVEKILVSVKEVTELKKLQNAASKQKRELETVGQLLAVDPNQFAEFVDSSKKFIPENKNLINKTVTKNDSIVSELF